MKLFIKVGHYKWYPLRFMANIMYTICAGALLWIFTSWFDVILHNVSENPVYQPWNAITFFVQSFS